MKALLRFAEHTAAEVAASLLGIDPRKAWDELHEAFASMDDVPCSHCGLKGHSHLVSDADWAAAREGHDAQLRWESARLNGTFGGGS